MIKEFTRLLTIFVLSGWAWTTQAERITFYLEYEGYGDIGGVIGSREEPNIFGTGMITIDVAEVNNPGENGSRNTGLFPISSLMLTITGGSAADGTYTESDFVGYIFNIPGTTGLDFTQELMGQVLSGPYVPWGTSTSNDSIGGAFGLFGVEEGPHFDACGGVQQCWAAKPDENLYLTSFKPKQYPPGLNIPLIKTAMDKRAESK
jgi:hypothetical protein